MTKRGKYMRAMSYGLIASLAAVWPAQAQSDDIEAQIKALEAEVQKIEPLKDQIERLRNQQLEMKKEATSAAAALPTFEWRPGRGMTIAASDKSWSFNTSARFNLYNYNVLGGKTNYNAGGTNGQTDPGTTFGEIYPRRARVYTDYCWQDCFFQMHTAIDGETAGDNGRQASFRDNEFEVHFDQLNPYLPYFSIGLRRGAGRTHVSRSSDNDGKVEHSIILDGFNWGGDGSHAGAGLGWEDIDIGPGSYELYLNYATSQQGTWQEFIPSDRKGFMMYIGGKPFSQMKNKWISGLEMGFGYQGQSMDRPDNFVNDEGTNIRVRNTERRGRVDLFRPGKLGTTATNCVANSDTCSGQNVGGGWADVFIPGLKWTVGPYFIRMVYVTTRYQNTNVGTGADAPNGRNMWGRGWTIDNQINLWSPKGFFTGNQTTPNSIILSFGFERADMNCGRGCDASPGSGNFHSQSVLNRETALWYWLQPSMGIGMWWHHWTTSNTPVGTQVAVGCRKSVVGANPGKSCTFDSIDTGLRVRW